MILERNQKNSAKRREAEHYTDYLNSYGRNYTSRESMTGRGAIDSSEGNCIEDNLVYHYIVSNFYNFPRTYSPSPIVYEKEMQIDVEDNIEDIIKSAHYITDLPDDWDEDGAIPISQATFDAAINFLKEYIHYLKIVLSTKIEYPEINPVKNGSIDLSWRTKNARMLVNIRQNQNEYAAYYYGDRYNNKMAIKGNVPVSEFSESLAVWMKYLV